MSDQQTTAEILPFVAAKPVPVLQQESFEITSVDQCVYLVSEWHKKNMATLRHLQNVPDGMPVKIGDENDTSKEADLILTGDVLTGYKLGLGLAISYFGYLPIAMVDEPQISEVSNSDGEQPV